MTALERLKKIDPDLLIRPCGAGNLLVSNTLQGRIMAEIGGKLIHRFDADLAEHPDPENFNNLGGNSLWPAPEGGDFAFNYPPKGGWYVQKGINSVKSTLLEEGQGSLLIGKEFELLNRRGKTVKVTWRRKINTDKAPLLSTLLCMWTFPSRPGVNLLMYRSEDTLELAEPAELDDVLISAWSLEQLPGAAGITAFGRCELCVEDAINTDFYGDPMPRITFEDRWFKFALGGPCRLQIGFSSAEKPELIGSFDPARGVAVLRTAFCQPGGRYINFADNDQKNGPFSAADQYSIFNGSEELDFHELETLAPMTLDSQGRCTGSSLESETLILRGSPRRVAEILQTSFAVPAGFLSI